MDDLVGRLLRELPDTDKDRYDIAYARGRAQVRSALLFGGLALGLATGAAATLLLDPSEGRGRRAAITERLGAVLKDVRAMVRARREDLPATPPSNAEQRAQATLPVRTRPDVRTPPRSAVASGSSRTLDHGREPVAAGVDG
jgi:hypothetical protein